MENKGPDQKTMNSRTRKQQLGRWKEEKQLKQNTFYPFQESFLMSLPAEQYSARDSETPHRGIPLEMELLKTLWFMRGNPKGLDRLPYLGNINNACSSGHFQSKVYVNLVLPHSKLSCSIATYIITTSFQAQQTKHLTTEHQLNQVKLGMRF